MTEKISRDDCIKLSKKILDDIYRPAYTFKTTIFLCGADISQTDQMRFKIAKALNCWKYRYQYDIIYPENIFEELLFSSKSRDLLSLEGLLAESVDAIVLIPESPGSYAELGAFANDKKLKRKLICVIDKKYKKDKNFINQGPLKLVKKVNKHGVVFVNPNDIENEIEKLNSSLKKLKKVSSKRSDKISLLQLENFLLPSIFLLQPVSIKILINLVASATQDEENAFQTTTTALTILTKKKQIELTTIGYKLTVLGVENFLIFSKTRSRIKRHDKSLEIDNLRLEILNLKYRNKKLKV